MSNLKILTAVFAYNRPLHLENCLKSLRDMFPDADVVVYDDNSSDPKVDEVISRFDCRVRKGQGGSGRHGGLYANMQLAYEDALEGGYDYLLSLQDDMQLVRPVGDIITDQYVVQFSANPRLTQIDIRFARGIQNRKFAHPRQNKDGPLQAFSSYKDVGLFHIGRLKSLGWSFSLESHLVVSGEQTLSLKAAELGMELNEPFTPFAMHLPFPTLYRNRLRIPRLSGLRKRIYRYDYMSETEILEMDARPKDTFAHWRQFLHVEDVNWVDRWLLSGKNDSKIIA